MQQWEIRLKKSNAAFLEMVWPIIKAKCGGGSIRPVEVMTDVISRDLDMLCGIDIWQTVDGIGCRGIASRVQDVGKYWRTFTVRRSKSSGWKTEYQKRKEAIESGGRMIYPYLTCQAYLKPDGSLWGGGLAKTKCVFGAINERTGIQHTYDASFYVVHFDDVAGIWEFTP